MDEQAKQQVGAIIGANGGVGRAVLEEMSGSAKKLYALTKGTELKTELKSEVIHLQIDICNYQDVEESFSKILDQNRLDFIVNCAGIAYYAPIGENYQTYWEEIYQVNVIGLLNLLSVIKKLVPDLKHFLNVSSLAAHRPSQTIGNISYSSAKMACVPLINHFRSELRRENNFMKVSSISPGFISETNFENRFFESFPDGKKTLYENFNSLKPQDVSRLIRYMLMEKDHVEISEIIVRPTEQPD